MKYKLSILLGLLMSVCVVAQQKFVGGDISLLPSYEAAKTPYKDASGKSIKDLVTYAHDVCHWNACRVRLFVDPVVTNADGKLQGEVQDLDYVKDLGRRIKEAGMAFMLDFHYSDTWADPVKQYIPRAWQSLSEEQLLDTVYGYTKMCLDTLVAAGATPDFVQVGNEISYGMLWRGTPNNTTDRIDPNKYDATTAVPWRRFTALLQNGTRAVREVCPNAQIIIHIERTADANRCVNFYKNIAKDSVDYDIIGLSYYPFWHGWLDKELVNTLSALHAAHPTKPIQIVETAYYNNYWPNDGSIKYNTSTKWAATPAGQDAYLASLIARLNMYDYVNGLYYWFPEENGNGGATWSANNLVISNWLNRGLFDPTTHKAYAGLYRLSEYIGVVSTDLAVSQEQCEETSKVIINGRLLIRYNEQYYTPLGVRVR